MFFLNLLLAYQLEQYHNIRFLKFVYHKPIFWTRGSKRQNIDWTLKALMLLSLSIIIFIGFNILVLKFYHLFVLLSLLVISLVYPFVLIIVNFLIYPIDRIVKKNIVSRAKSKLKKYPDLKVIWITWSYGKTSTKEYLKKILSSKFNVIATPWTYNTEIWISKFILEDLDENTQILVLEMWAYLPWDIQKLCDITKLDIWIISGITEQHLERFGNIENIIKTKFELLKNIKDGWLFVFDWENKNIQNWLNLYDSELQKIEQIWIWKLSVSFLSDLWWIEFNFDGVWYKSKLLWRHNAKNLSIAISVAKKLWIEEKTIQLWVSNIDFVPHRMQLIKWANWVYVIDDSFNGNIEWVKSTIDLLKNICIDWRKIYLTPGLVELGDISEKIHLEIWNLLSDVVDKILLIKNSSTEYIQKWLLENWFKSENIKIYDSAILAHEDLKSILQRWDVIVFQNDWTDNYL